MRTSFFVGESSISPLQHGADLGKGGWRPHHRDEGGLLLEAITGPDKKDVDELPIVDGVSELMKFVGDGFEALTVDADGGVALHGVSKLSVKGIDPGIDVVLEELTKSGAESGGGRCISKHEVEDLD